MNVSNVVFALIVLAIYSIIAQFENIYLVPQLVGGRVNLHPAIAFVCGVGGGLVFGALGVFLATPTVGSLRLIFVYVYRKLLDQEPFEDHDRTPSSVRIRGLIGGRKIEAIIFDLDGTLTAVDWRATAWAAQPVPWLDWLVPAEYRRLQMRRLMITAEGFINFLVSQLQRTDATKLLARLLPLFNHLRGYPPPEALTLQEGVLPTLNQLRTSYQLALITVRDQPSLQYFLQATWIDASLFHTIATRDDVRNLLPHSQGLLYLAQQLALAPEQILVVSDSDVNLRAGRAMGMAAAGVLSGLGEEQDMRDADIVLHNVAELTEWL
jgi:HAD superfamily hydrolase (TIGR01509 family)